MASQDTPMTSQAAPVMIDPSIFEYLKTHGEQELEVSETLSRIVSSLNRHVAIAQGHLSRIHATPNANREHSTHSKPCTGPELTLKTGPALLAQIEKDGIQPEIATVAELAQYASKFPYYKCGPVSLPPSSHRQHADMIYLGTTGGGLVRCKMS